MGAIDQDAHRARPARRRDAAVVRREEHRHPGLQAGSVAERRGDRDDREVGRRRRAARQCRRHAEAARFRERRQVAARRAGSDREIRRTSSSPPAVPTVGLARHGADGLTEDRYVSSVEVREVNDIPIGGATQDGRRTLRVSPHDLRERGARRRRVDGGCGSVGHELADSRSGPQPRHLPARSGPAAAKEFIAGVERVPLALERPRDEGASRVRLQVLPGGLQAALQALDAASRQRHRPRREAGSEEPGAALVRDAAGAHQDHRVRAAPARAGRAHVPRSDLGPQHPDAELRRLRSQLGQAVRL